MIRRFSNEKIDLFVNKSNLRMTAGDVTKRDYIEYLLKLILELTDEYFSKHHFFIKKQRVTKKSSLKK